MPFTVKLLLIFIALAGGSVLALSLTLFDSKDSKDSSTGLVMPEATAILTRPAPSPTPALAVLPGCSRWPAEVVEAVGRLPRPEGLCLKLVSRPQDMPDICAIWVACYDADDLTIWELTNPTDVLARTPRFSGLSRAFFITHELCHAHQHYQIRMSTPGGFQLLQEDMSRWRFTAQGREFAAVEAELPADYFPLVSHSLEDFAHLCAAWLLPDASRKQLWIERWPALRAYFTKWLPNE